jgi:hypothetical protein
MLAVMIMSAMTTTVLVYLSVYYFRKGIRPKLEFVLIIALMTKCR